MTTSIATRAPSNVRSAAPAVAADRSDRLTATQQRAERLREMNIEFISHPSFRHPEYVESLLAMELPALHDLQEVRGGLSSYLTGLYEVELLTSLEEEQLFALMNLVKFQAHQLREGLDARRPAVRTMNQIEDLLRRGDEVRNHIVRANLRLVVALAKKFANSPSHLEDLICEGHLPLIRAVELFDFSRGYRFSTYATWAVRNHFLRIRKDDARYQERYHDGDLYTFEHATDMRSSWQADESQRSTQQAVVHQLLSQLPEREREILNARFGLNGQRSEQTLAEIGAEMGLSKERVRQLAVRALEKLGAMAVPAIG